MANTVFDAPRSIRLAGIGAVVLVLLVVTLLGENSLLFPVCALGGVVAIYVVYRIAPSFLRKPFFWIAVLIPFFIGFLLQPAERTAFSAGGIQADLVIGALTTGAVMSLRVCNLLAIFHLFNKLVSVEDFLHLFSRLGWKGFGFAVAVAFNVLSELSERSRTVFQTIRLRGGFRRNPIRGCILYCVHMIYTTLLQGEEIIKTAVARGFSP